MMRLAAALAALSVAATALAVPLPPRQLRVVPVYGTTLRVDLSWIDRGGVNHYNIFRQVDGGALSLLATFAGGSADDLVIHSDTAVTATSMYTYQVDACDATGCVSAPPFTTSPRVVWPIPGGHEVLHGFNEVIATAGIGETGSPVGFHMGLDLNKPSDASVVDIVVAPRGGVVHSFFLGRNKDGTLQPDNGAIGVLVDVGDGDFELDTFNHLLTEGPTVPPTAVGDVVAPGQPIGVIGTRVWNLNSMRHVHHMNERPAPRPPGEQRIIRHPLLTFTEPADRDPLGNPPALFDENKDGKVVLFRTHQADGGGALVNYDFTTTPLHGDVDVEPEVVDEQGTNPGQAPIDLGYWIEGPLPSGEQLDDVKSPEHAYRLYDFREEYFGGIAGGPPPTPCHLVSDVDGAANAGCVVPGPRATRCTVDPRICSGGPSPGLSCTVDADCGSGGKCFLLGCTSSVIKEGTSNFGWHVLHHFVVTHAKGETGARADVDANQFWRTAAQDDGGPVDSTHANYAGKPTTTKAWEARFPDGDYVIHVVASDLVHDQVDLPIRDHRVFPGPAPGIRLENFAPFVKEILVAQDADGNPGTGEPGLAGCEVVLRHYRHTHRHPYLRPQDLLVSKPTAIAHTGQKLCVRIRFSEPVTSATVDLIRERGAGTPVPGGGFTGALSKTHNTDDTWTGSLTLPADASGDSDVSPSGDERDAAIRIVALDRRDAAGATRGLDANSDGVPEPGGDLSHVLKLDLTRPTGVLDVVKP